MANERIIKELMNPNDLDFFSSINQENAWLNRYNKESYLKLLERPIPSNKNEEWRYTKISEAVNQFFLKAKENKLEVGLPASSSTAELQEDLEQAEIK